jgi:hypothetical protein
MWRKSRRLDLRLLGLRSMVESPLSRRAALRYEAAQGFQCVAMEDMQLRARRSRIPARRGAPSAAVSMSISRGGRDHGFCYFGGAFHSNSIVTPP